MEIPDTMSDAAFKRTIGYMYYKAKKVESKKAKGVEESKEQNVSPAPFGGVTSEESANETDDADESDMNLTDDNPNEDDAAAAYGVF
nr:hypothetical protein [Tanacetum cinerariifolium]